MELRKCFESDFLNADEFEAIGLCYQELRYYIPDVDVSFALKAMDRPRRISGQIGMERLNALRENLCRVAQNSQMRQGSDFFALASELLSMLQHFEYPDDMEQKECIGIGLYYLLTALDEYVKLGLQRAEEYGEANKISPLNHGKSLESCQVHWNKNNSFLSGAYKPGKAGFRTPLTACELGDMFQSFQIIETVSLAQFRQKMQPNIIRVPLCTTSRDAIQKKKMIRIASIPFIGFDTFGFHEVDSEFPCPPEKEPEGEFYIEYPQEEENSIRLVVSLVDLAIEQGANLIVLPEFVISPRMRKAIAKCLYEKRKTSQVILVFAGTTYEWDPSTQKGNNVLHILNNRGKEVGTYYKYSRFLTKLQGGFHEAVGEMPKEEVTAGLVFKHMERLSDPGKICTLFDVEKIGRILPAVCRDIVDGKYTSGLVNLFRPNIVLAPAWSRSVVSFDTFLKQYANTTHTASLLCNCCNAVSVSQPPHEGEKETGRFCIPRKEKSAMDAKIQPISRPAECLVRCREQGGCVVFIDVDFSAGIPVAQVERPIHPQ